MAGLGVQLLFGFLLAMPFTVRFAQLNQGQRDLYKVSLLFAALATALLIAPVAYHRWVFRRHEKGRLLNFANVVAILGLASVTVAISAAVWLVVSFVGATPLFSAFAAVVTASFVALWFAVPIAVRLGTDEEEGSTES